MMTAYRHVGKVSMLAAVATALLVCTGAVGAAGQAAVGDKVLALWLWGSTVRSQGADKVAQDLAKHGVTDVFLLVRGTAGKADYQSSLAPPAEEGKEALGDLLKACRPLGIKVHAWSSSPRTRRTRKSTPRTGCGTTGTPAPSSSRTRSLTAGCVRRRRRTWSTRKP